MQYKIKKPDSNRKPALIALIIVVVLLLGALAYWLRAVSTTDRQSDQTDSEKIDLSPPTEEEKAETQQHKDDLSDEQSDPSSVSADGKRQVTPIITSASRTEVRAYVSGIVEEGGACTATATQGSQTVTGNSDGIDNVSNTQCAPITWNLGAGTWSVAVSYNSVKAQGVSQPAEVK